MSKPEFLNFTTSSASNLQQINCIQQHTLHLDLFFVCCCCASLEFCLWWNQCRPRFKLIYQLIIIAVLFYYILIIIIVVNHDFFQSIISIHTSPMLCYIDLRRSAVDAFHSLLLLLVTCRLCKYEHNIIIRRVIILYQCTRII